MAVVHLTDHPRYAGTLDHLDRIRLAIVLGILSNGTEDQRQTVRDFIDDQPIAALLEVHHA